MNEAWRPQIEEVILDGAHLYLAHNMTVGTYEEQESVVAAPVYEPLTHEKGKLMPIGGNAGRRSFEVLSGEVVEVTGVTVVTFPTMLPEKRYRDIEEPLRDAGVVGPIYHVRANLLPDVGARMMARSSLIMISGGDQVRGRAIFEAAGLDRKLIESWNSGKSIAGTSAGSNLLGKKMPYGETIENGFGMTEMGLDTHFKELNRYGRQEDFVAETGKISIGLDENTGIGYQNGIATAFGSGEAVVRYDNGRMEDPIVLHEGDSFNIFALSEYVGSFSMAA